MRILVHLLVVAQFAAVISAQYDVNFNIDEPILSFFPDEDNNDPNADNDIKWNPDEKLVVPEVQAADDDKTVCDNKSGDGRETRACCFGTGLGDAGGGAFIRVFRCRKCKIRVPFLSNLNHSILCIANNHVWNRRS